MGRIVATLALVALASVTAGAQTPSAFVDVPPWHWAFDAVQEGAAQGIFTGYPTNDRESVANAFVQIYDAFAHAQQPAAREWAEWFLTNTPPGWPLPLAHSRLVSFALENLQVDVGSDQATAIFVAVTAVRANGSVFTMRAPVQARAERDGSGHWRVDYATLATGQPQIFR